MSSFHAPLSQSSDLIGGIYTLDVVPPPCHGVVGYTLAANVVEDIPTTKISRHLAREFGANHEGDEIEIRLRQRSHLTLNVHQFYPIPLEIQYAMPKLGPYYLLIGMDDLHKFFKISRYPGGPSPPFLLFEPHDHYLHWCHELTAGATP